MMDDPKNTHAYLAPSSAHRWINCTASPSKVDQLREEKVIGLVEATSAAASEGTAMHDLSEAILRHKIFGEDAPEEEVPTDLWTYINHCWDLHEECGDATILIEDHVPLFYSPDETGTVDFLVICGGERMFVRDLKWGHKIVKSERNPQLAIYALSAALAHGFVDPDGVIDIGIVQPRLSDPEIVPWVLTFRELALFCAEISDAVTAIREKKDLVFRPSPSVCQWCPAKAHCAARIGPVADTIEAIPEDAVSGEDLTESQRILIWENRERITAILKDVQADFYQSAMNGVPPPNTKLVVGRQGNRQWDRSDDEVIEFLHGQGIDPYAEKKIISPSQAEKLGARKDAVRDRVTRSPGKPVLADASDNRPDYIGDTSTSF